MTQNPYGAPGAVPAPQGAYPAPGGYGTPPRKRRGIKRTVFGVLGLLANAVGLVVMPILVGVIGGIIGLAATQNLTALDPQRAMIQTETLGVYNLAVPSEFTETVQCAVTSGDATLEQIEVPSVDSGSIDGVPYYDAYDLTVHGAGEVVVECSGTEALALWEAGMGGILVSAGIGLVLPIVLGLLSLALTVWGVVALIRSS